MDLQHNIVCPTVFIIAYIYYYIVYILLYTVKSTIIDRKINNNKWLITVMYLQNDILLFLGDLILLILCYYAVKSFSF